MRPRIVVVGVGALGSHFVLAARNIDASLRVVDFDRVETKNLLAQFHTKMGSGKNKAQALQAAMLGLFGLKLEAVPHRLTSDNAEQLLGDANLVVDCLDNGASRRLVQNFVRAKSIPCLHGAVDAAGTYGRVAWDSRFVIDDEAKVGQPTCEGGEHLPFLIVIAAHLALATRSFVNDGRQVGYEVHPGGVMRG